MASVRLIRNDDYGLYVLTGGYAFRPPAVALEHFPGHGPSRWLSRIREQPDGPFKDLAEEHVQQQVVIVEEAAKRPTAHKPGDHVRATHIGGSQLARVGGETWVSLGDADPQYVAYTSTFA